MNLHDSSVWTAVNGENPTIGTSDACAQVTKKHEDDYVSFFDTSIKVIIDAESKFQTFEKAITVVGTSMKSLEDNQKKTIKLDSYLCGPSDSGDPGCTYKIGQSFSICIGPSEDEKINYDYLRVVAFEEVTCGEIEVVEDGVETALTIVTTDPTNYKKADGASVGVGVLSFETVVTPKYYTGGSAEDEALVTCSGTVELVGFTEPLKFKKAGCRKTPLERGLNGPLFPLDNGGVESDVKQCNDFCKPTSETKYFLLDCPHFLVLGRLLL